jgi:hypothetical protein
LRDVLSEGIVCGDVEIGYEGVGEEREDGELD